MNDRFKFRVWDKREKSYIEAPSPTPLLQADGLLAYFTNHPEYMENYDIQFCTGLKDKNCKLIYEGDIIQIQGCTEKAKVEYSLEKGMFLLVGKTYAPSAFMTIRKDYWEVIGNIYENPELLQECE